MPENLSRLREDVRRAEEKIAELGRNITILERVKTQDEKRIQAATNDITRAEETLKKQQKDLVRVIQEQKENLEKLEGANKLVKEYARNQADLKRKLEQLTREIAANDNRAPSQQKRTGTGGIFGR